MSEMHSMIMSVDPGFGGTGVSIFVDGKLYDFANIKSSKKDTMRYIDISAQCEQFVENAIESLHRCVGYSHMDRIDILIESPHAMGGVKGYASLTKGDVFKVAKLAGAIGVVLYDSVDHNYGGQFPAPKIKLHYPEVRVWKGQVPKETTKRRVLRDVRYFDDICEMQMANQLPSHIYDAIGIGLWFINKFATGEVK